MTSSNDPPRPPGDQALSQAKPGKRQGSRPAFPIVGIGASAGGLEALTEFLPALEPALGMAYVIVQHLAPERHSYLTEILAKSATMPVLEVVDSVAILANHIYVMPPGFRVTITNSQLKLSPRGKAKGSAFNPIDAFFTSLATNCKELAVGVILSGSGSDGARGVSALLAGGGVALAQDSKSARYTGMPDAAIDAGADSILSPHGLARELFHVSRSIQMKQAFPPSPTKPAEAGNFEGILQILNTAKGIDFSQYKQATIYRRILRRMTICRLEQVDDYVAHIKEKPSEIDNLCEDMLVKVTCFFRVSDSFIALKEQIRPLVLAKSPFEKLRVWVPGCATGEEAYSLAIILHELFEEVSRSNRIEIFASDISEAALNTARQGIYDASISEHVSPARLERFFIKEPEGYRVCQRVREICIFAKQNIVRDPPFSKIDLVSCRNLDDLLFSCPATQSLSGLPFWFKSKGPPHLRQR